jgi:hypothetical protein
MGIAGMPARGVGIKREGGFQTVPAAHKLGGGWVISSRPKSVWGIVWGRSTSDCGGRSEARSSKTWFSIFEASLRAVHIAGAGGRSLSSLLTSGASAWPARPVHIDGAVEDFTCAWPAPPTSSWGPRGVPARSFLMEGIFFTQNNDQSQKTGRHNSRARHVK